MKLLQELFAEGLLTEERMNEFKQQIEKSDKKEEDIILENRIVTEDFLFNLKSKISGIPLIKIEPDQISLAVMDLIPEEASINYKMIATGKTKEIVQIGMVYPEDIIAQNALRFLANQGKFEYQTYLITPSNLLKIFKQRQNISGEAKKVLASLPEVEIKSTDNLGGQSLNEVKSEEAPIIKMVLVILRHAIEGNASDIHIEPNRDKLNVRFRLNGILNPSLSLPLKVHLAIVARIKILSGLKIDENRIPQDGRFSARINNKDIDFRVATFPTLYGEKVELRVLDPAAGLKSFDDLGLTKRSLDVVKEAIAKPYGMILFTGPTGSGKTTTQYAILRILNKESVNVVTLEDPIEYSIAGINQSQVKPEIGYTFAQGLRQILRQDPNVIMVGEIRDEETADLAINAALTGHIVLSTLHTNTSTGVIPRLMDMGVKPFLIPSTLRVVIAQRLVRTLCQNCKIKIKPPEKMKEFILQALKNIPASVRKDIKIEENMTIYTAKGCEICGLTGYSGRIGLYEVLSMTEELAEAIQTNLSELSILKVAQKQGMLTMAQEGVLKVLNGQTTVEEIIRVTEER